MTDDPTCGFGGRQQDHLKEKAYAAAVTSALCTFPLVISLLQCHLMKANQSGLFSNSKNNSSLQ